VGVDRGAEVGFVIISGPAHPWRPSALFTIAPVELKSALETIVQ